MHTPFIPISNVDALRGFVNETLCEHYELKLDAFEMTERILRRGGRPCGMYFCLHGPRAVKFTAIWEMDHNRILFYGSTGERFLKMQLLDTPSLDRAAA